MKRITFTETGEVRPPRKGEWYSSNRGVFFSIGPDFANEQCHILTRTEEEVPDPPKPRQVVWVETPKGGVGQEMIGGKIFSRVEVPTKAEIPSHGSTTPPYLGGAAFSATQEHINGYWYGINWLADKLGIKIE